MYLTKTLHWTNQLHRFSENQKKVLLALSHDRYKWRTRQAILEVTGLSEEMLDSTLSDLIKQQLVRASFSRNKNLLLGLRERVG